MADEIQTDEAMSLDHTAAAELLRDAAYPLDYYMAFASEDDATDWASMMALDLSTPYCVLFLTELGEWRAGPVDEMDVLAAGGSDFELVAVYDEAGALADLEDDMFDDLDDEDADLADEDLVGLDDEDRALEETIRRMSAASRRNRARTRRKRKPKTQKRRLRSRKAKLWRRRNKAKLKRYRKRYSKQPWVRREDVAQDLDTESIEEALIRRRSLSTRRHAQLKSKLTTMDAKRRKTAARAKRWRSSNRSGAKRYASLYRDPRRKVEGVVTISSTISRMREAGNTPAQIADALLGLEPLVDD